MRILLDECVHARVFIALHGSHQVTSFDAVEFSQSGVEHYILISYHMDFGGHLLYGNDALTGGPGHVNHVPNSARPVNALSGETIAHRVKPTLRSGYWQAEAPWDLKEVSCDW